MYRRTRIGRLFMAVVLAAAFAAFPREGTAATHPVSADSITVDLDALSAAAIAEGDACAEKRDFSCAIRSFNRALELRPHNAEALKRRGFAHFYSNETAQAAVDFARALEESPGEPGALYGQGLVFSRDHQLSRAIEAFGKALAVIPGDTAVLGERAHDYVLQRRAAEALADTETILAQEPDNTKARIDHARSLILIGKISQALADADQLASNPDNAAVGYYLRGAALARSGEAAEARRAFDHSIGIDASDDAYLGRARLHGGATADQRLADVEQSRILGAGPAAALAVRGSIELDRGDPTDAIADANQALRLAEGDTDIVLLHAELFTRAHRPAPALTDLDGVLRELPDDAQALSDRCWLRALTGQALEKARADCEAVLSRSPGFSPALAHRGFVQLRSGQTRAALADFEAALSIAPGAAEPLYGRALIRMREGHVAGGKTDLAAARVADPGLETVLEAYGLSDKNDDREQAGPSRSSAIDPM